MFNTIYHATRDWAFDVLNIFWGLVKIMVPILIVVKFVEELGWIVLLGEGISPIMSWVGLPGEMGLVWVTAITGNLYAGMALFYQFNTVEQLTVAQVSILSSMMLIAHGLPIEAAVAKAVGVSLRFTLLLRVGGALLFGVILHLSYQFFDVLQTPVSVYWVPEHSNGGWLSWLIVQVKTLVAALCIIALLTLLLRGIRHIGLEKFIHFLLSPLLRLLGIGSKASNIIVIGFLLGLTFGGSLLIKEEKDGEMTRKDIFLIMAFLGLSHSIIEDTLLMLLLGADLLTILWIRLIFAFIVVAALARGMDWLMQSRFAYRLKNKRI
ncbi:hypothetical protein J3L16_14340 [Alteromonas sp. 5E99-2]|uniref:nucleoside recognition domain-containing protein n=1 Tax=Alteromonas sp. 5E99-2 TaxID=2817683 RepID=UPI001A98E715|nr:nucleoside recognition domain-containing protein [Alteromonas sp. 5E99-2]MBO1256870.1 hypothetical protein [Alteromonas sp. 5E99-2]